MSPKTDKRQRRKKQGAGKEKRKKAEQDNAHLLDEINQLLDHIIVVVSGGTPPA